MIFCNNFAKNNARNTFKILEVSRHTSLSRLNSLLFLYSVFISTSFLNLKCDIYIKCDLHTLNLCMKCVGHFFSFQRDHIIKLVSGNHLESNIFLNGRGPTSCVSRHSMVFHQIALNISENLIFV